MKSSVIMLAVIAAAIGANAYADDRRAPAKSDAAATAAVSFSDLEVSRPEDARVLLARVQAAAREVCGRSFTHGDASACVHATVDRAVEALDRPQVSAIYQQTYLAAAPSFP